VPVHKDWHIRAFASGALASAQNFTDPGDIKLNDFWGLNTFPVSCFGAAIQVGARPFPAFDGAYHENDISFLDQAYPLLYF
jgi:hypothetical protein